MTRPIQRPTEQLDAHQATIDKYITQNVARRIFNASIVGTDGSLGMDKFARFYRGPGNGRYLFKPNHTTIVRRGQNILRYDWQLQSRPELAEDWFFAGLTYYPDGVTAEERLTHADLIVHFNYETETYTVIEGAVIKAEFESR